MWPFKQFFILLLFGVSVSSLETEHIKQYFQNEHIQFVNIYHCFDKRAEVKFIRNLITDFTLRSFNINELKFINKSDIFLERNIRFGIWIDAINCPYEDVFWQLSRMQAFKGIHYFLIFMKDINLIEPAFKNIILTVNSNIKIMLEDHTVYDVYNPSTLHGGKLVYTPFRKWNTEARQFSKNTKHINMYFTRRNMTGTAFKAMVVLPKPHPGKLDDYLQDDSDRKVNILNRYHAVLMFHSQDFYNYSLTMSKTNSWGYIYNGTFDGLVRALEIHQVDFGSCLFVKDERWPKVDYGRRTWTLRSAFMFRAPKRPASFEVFLRPLDMPVWYFTAIACVIIIILLKLSLTTEISQFHHDPNTFEPSWSHIFLCTFGALCGQGCDATPSGISSRISFLFIFIFTVLLYQYYTASIVSILIMAPAKFIKTLEDLAHSSLVLGSEDVGYHRDYIRKFENDSVIGLLPKRSPSGDISSFYVNEPEKGLEKVQAGGYALHIELVTAYPIMAKIFNEDTICSLDEIPLYHLQQMHQPLQKGSEFREMLDHILQKMGEFGVMDRQLKHWHAKRPECIRDKPVTNAVSLEEFYPALTFLLMGIFMSIFVLIVEYIVYIYQKKKDEKMIIKQLRISKKHGRITRVRPEADLKRDHAAKAQKSTGVSVVLT